MKIDKLILFYHNSYYNSLINLSVQKETQIWEFYLILTAREARFKKKSVFSRQFGENQWEIEQKMGFWAFPDFGH